MATNLPHRGRNNKGPWCSLECTPACQAGGRGFKSRRDRTTEHGRVAQLAERPPEKRKVTGSTPVPTTTHPPTARSEAQPRSGPCPLRETASALAQVLGSRIETSLVRSAQSVMARSAVANRYPPAIAVAVIRQLPKIGRLAGSRRVQIAVAVIRQLPKIRTTRRLQIPRPTLTRA